MSEFDSLFEQRPGNKWKPTKEQQEWLEGLADEVVARGQIPTWKTVHEAYLEKFDTDYPKSPGSVKSYVQRLISSRG